MRISPARNAAARDRAEMLRPILAELGGQSLRAIASELNARSIPAAAGQVRGLGLPPEGPAREAA